MQHSAAVGGWVIPEGIKKKGYTDNFLSNMLIKLQAVTVQAVSLFAYQRLISEYRSVMYCVVPCIITAMGIGTKRWRYSMRCQQIRKRIFVRQTIRRQKKIALKKYKLVKF